MLTFEDCCEGAEVEVDDNLDLNIRGVLLSEGILGDLTDCWPGKLEALDCECECETLCLFKGVGFEIIDFFDSPAVPFGILKVVDPELG